MGLTIKHSPRYGVYKGQETKTSQSYYYIAKSDIRSLLDTRQETFFETRIKIRSIAAYTDFAHMHSFPRNRKKHDTKKKEYKN